MEIKKIGIVGQGALGVMYGNYLKNGWEMRMSFLSRMRGA